MHRIIQMATQLQQSEEQNAQTLRALAEQSRDSRLTSQLRTLESKERSAANQLRQIISELNHSGPAGNRGTAAASVQGGTSGGPGGTYSMETSGLEKTNWEE